ncbi:MAG: ribonuclease H-like domain-containing protein [Candidatus Heimdallarchaeota archaeon]|nr:ribonuclease H-like domain-containing protein [Candidatus Heimdallarchaeota archaeon]
MERELFLDIETTGLESKDEIVLINLQNGFDGSHEKFLSWESSEKEILEELLQKIQAFPTSGNNKLQMIGYNTLCFDIPFIINRCIFHKIRYFSELYKIFYLDCWQIDLLQVFMSRNNFYYLNWNIILKTYGLPETKGSGREIPNWYKNKEYDKILTYVDSEFKHLPSIYYKVKSGDFRF